MNDTAFGINNEGSLVFDYYHEDHDQVEGANVYNGQNSTLWVNFRQSFQDLIQETYQDLRSNSVLNYDELINQFITKGSDKWSESIYNEDGDFKYISMLRTENDATNLPQIRGTGEEHLRYFIENRLNYCDSKWYAGKYPEDIAVIRIYTPKDSDDNPRTDLVIPVNSNVTVTPYSAMYAGVRYKSNGTLTQERLNENETHTFIAPNEIFTDTEIAIYGASQLSSLGDLAPLYLGYIDIGAATKLVELKIGDGTPGYRNAYLYHLAVGTNRLLKKIDIQNCNSPRFVQALVLSGCPNIEEVYAKGSSITGVELPDSGYLKVLQLPATVTNLTLKNQLYIEDFSIEGYDNLRTIWCENCPSIDTLTVLNNAPNVERVRLTNVDWEWDDASVLYELIERDLAGIDENGVNTDTMWIDGKCKIKNITGAEFAEIKRLYPYLELSYETLTSQLIFMSEDGETELTRQTILNAGDGADIYGDRTIYCETGDIDYQNGALKDKNTRLRTPYIPINGASILNLSFENIPYTKFILRVYKANETFVTIPSGDISNVWDGGIDGSWFVINSNPGAFNLGEYIKNSAVKIEDVEYIRLIFTINDSTPIIETKGNFSVNGVVYNAVTYPFEKTSTAQYHFAFNGWSLTPGGEADPDALLKVEGDRIVYMSFEETLRSYTVNFYNGTTLLQTDTVSYGSDATYRGTTPDGCADYLTFIGWSPDPTNIQGDTNCYAQYYDSRVIEDDWTTIAANCANGTYATKYDIGARKPVEITYKDGTSETIDFEIIAKDHDELTDDAKRWVMMFDNAKLFGTVVHRSVVVNNTLWASTNVGLSYLNGSSLKSVGKCPNYSQYHYLLNFNNELHIITSAGVATQPYHYKYDNGTSSWVEVSTMPVADSPNYTTAVVFNNCIYYIRDKNRSYFVYDGVSWSEKQVIDFTIVGNNNCPITVYNGEIHLIAGNTNENVTTHIKFDGETWATVCQTPYSMKKAKLITHNSVLYSFGGINNPKSCYKFTGANWIDAEMTCEPYDEFESMVEYNSTLCSVGVNRLPELGGGNGILCLEERGWVDLIKDDNIRAVNGVIVFRDEIYYMAYGSKNLCKVDFTATQGSTIVCSLTYICSAMCLYNDEFHFICQISSDRGSAVHYKYNPDTNELVEVSVLPDGVKYYNCGMVVYDGKIHLFNGSQSKIHYIYDGESWVEFGTMPYHYYLTNNAICVYNNEIHAMLYNSKKHYKFDGTAWTLVSNAPVLFNKGSLFVYNNELQFIGGPNQNEWYKFNGVEWINTGLTTPFKVNNNVMVVYHNHIWRLGEYASSDYNIYRLENPKASLTFLAKNLLKDARQYHSIHSAYWSMSDLRAWCNGEFYNSLPEDLQASISEVIKVSDTGYAAQSLENVYDKIWICSLEELGCDDDRNIPGQGSTYPIFTDDNSRKRCTIDGAASNYATRSTIKNHRDTLHIIYGNSGKNSYAAFTSDTIRTLPGFCI